MLTARTDGEGYVEAAVARRGEGYRCRACGAPVIFKPGRVRTAHFAHRPAADCAFGGPMSAAHLVAQERVAAALRARGLVVELEAPLSGAGGDRRIDVLASPSGRPQARVAIEIQASDITAAAIEARSASYQALGVAPLWLRLLDFARFTTVQLCRCEAASGWSATAPAPGSAGRMTTLAAACGSWIPGPGWCGEASSSRLIGFASARSCAARPARRPREGRIGRQPPIGSTSTSTVHSP